MESHKVELEDMFALVNWDWGWLLVGVKSAVGQVFIQGHSQQKHISSETAWCVLFFILYFC